MSASLPALISPAQLYPARGGRPAYQLLDVRAPVEVAAGALPEAVTEPILNDSERYEVGIRYKEAGQEAAITLGFDLTDAQLPGRVAAWQQVVAAGPTAVACWRGGLRSRLTAEFIGDSAVMRVEGGYKAIRKYLMDQLPLSLARYETIVVGGLTGSGKTALLERLATSATRLNVLDLEHQARHRGSSFGRLAEAQPAQATFENSVALQLLLGDQPRLVLEDEARSIGHIELPEALYGAILRSPLVLVDEPLAARAARIHHDYVLSLSDTLGVPQTRAYLGASLLRLKKRLSGAVVTAALQALEDAEASGAWRDAEAHAGWITPLLERYYDPLYRKALGAAPRPVLFSGDLEACYAWLTR